MMTKYRIVGMMPKGFHMWLYKIQTKDFLLWHDIDSFDSYNDAICYSAAEAELLVHRIRTVEENGYTEARKHDLGI